MLSAAAVSLFTALTVFFFSPEEMFLANPIDYHYGIKEIMLPMLLLAAAGFAALFLLFMLLLLIHENLFHVCKCLLFGFTAAGYVQTLFLNEKMVQFTGTYYEYDSSDPFIMADWFIFYLIVFLPLICFLCTKVKNKPKFADLFSPAIIPALSCIFCIMQTAGFLPGLFRVQKTLRGQDNTQESYLSYAPLMSLSDEHNIVVFLTDCLDGAVTQEMLETYPELHDSLEGFTFYRNNISRNQQTFPTVAEMLSGLDYRGELWMDFIGQVWENNQVLPKLHENNWQVNLILDSNSTYATVPRLKGSADNIAQTDLKGSINYFGEGGIVPTQMRFSLVKLMPYFMKSLMYADIEPQFANNFTVTSGENTLPDRHTDAVSVESDIRFYEYLKQNGLRADSEKKTFSFIHLIGIHGESSALETLYPDDDPGSSSLTATARGEFVILEAYLQEMKRIGVFDNSDIIILSDHAYSLGNETRLKERLEKEMLSTLLIKPANAAHEPLRTDIEAEMSDVYLSASILDYAGIDHSALGISYGDELRDQLHAPRDFCMYLFSGMYEQPYLGAAYRVRGNALDFANWEYAGTELPEYNRTP